jgi:tRNA 2-thiouridine synthesizing protein A
VNDESALIDARGLRCPWPVLRLARAVRGASSGTIVTIVADDPIAPAEINAFANERGFSVRPVQTAIGRGISVVV